MRILAGRYRRKIRRKRQTKRLALCGTLRHHVPVPRRSVRTAEYSESARKRLGDAVADAREAAGFPKRPAFVRATGVGQRSLEAVECYEPKVGSEALKKIGAALGQFHPNWNEATPKKILDGGPIPAITATAPRRRVVLGVHFEPGVVYSPEEPEFWWELEKRLDKEYLDPVRKLYEKNKEAQRLLQELRKQIREQNVPHTPEQPDAEGSP